MANKAYKIRVRKRPRRTFLDGLASIFDFTGSLHSRTTKRLPPETADQFAMWLDWKAVGDDFRAVIGDWETYHIADGSNTSDPPEVKSG